jgi:peptidoglycan/LPS O-acetylase OafA/YrhL
MNPETYDRATGLRFMARRLIRVEIPFVASIVVAGAILWFAARFGSAQPQSHLALTMLLNALYLVPFTDHPWLQIVYWTLFYEIIFYLLIALFYGFVRQITPVRLFTLTTILGLAIALFAEGHNAPRALCFVMGICVYFFVRWEWSLRSMAIGIAIAAAIMAALGHIPGAIAGALTVFLICADRQASKPWRYWAWLRALGSISYSLYLTHGLSNMAFANRLIARFPVLSEAHGLRVMLFTLLAITVATLFYLIVEKPAQSLARKVRPRYVTPVASGMQSDSEGSVITGTAAELTVLKEMEERS